MENNDEKIKYVTSGEMDKKLEEHAQVIISAVDTIITTRLGKVNERLDEVESKLEKKIDGLQTDVDWLVKKQSDFEQEHVIMKEEVKQMKGVLKDKLGVEIEAV